MGERTPLALIDAPASGRMAVAEAITNIAAAAWRGSPTSSSRRTGWRPPGIPARMPRSTTRVRAVAMELCPALGISDSGRQGFDVDAHDVARRAADKAVTAPVSLIVIGVRAGRRMRGAR